MCKRSPGPLNNNTCLTSDLDDKNERNESNVRIKRNVTNDENKRKTKGKKCADFVTKEGTINARFSR